MGEGTTSTAWVLIGVSNPASVNMTAVLILARCHWRFVFLRHNGGRKSIVADAKQQMIAIDVQPSQKRKVQKLSAVRNADIAVAIQEPMN